MLENELDVADIAALAEAVGFHDTTLLASTPYLRHEFPAEKLGTFPAGAGFSGYWGDFSQHLMVHHYILIHMGPNVPATDRAGGARLRAALDVEDPADAHGQLIAGKPGRAVISVENRGDAVWLHAEGRGWTRLGGHLYAVKNGSRELIDYDWLRTPFERDVEPEDRVVLAVDLPAIANPGSYKVEFDVVLEGVTWFAKRGSPTATMSVTVE